MSQGSHAGSLEEAKALLAQARQEAEWARAKLQKVSEILRTLSTLSHKINNPLTSLLGRVQLLKLGAEADPKTIKATGVIEESGYQIARLIKELGHVVKQGRREVEEGPGDPREDS